MQQLNSIAAFHVIRSIMFIYDEFFVFSQRINVLFCCCKVCCYFFLYGKNISFFSNIYLFVVEYSNGSLLTFIAF